MALTVIEWTSSVRPDGTAMPGYTFNPHRGCCKISEGCRNCYAETLSKRNPKTLGVWGPLGTRAPASEAYWRSPVAWNRTALAAGERHRIFCASLADVFEGSDTCQDADAYAVVTASRARLFPLIEATPGLDWLLLTKRLQNIMGEKTATGKTSFAGSSKAAFDCSGGFSGMVPEPWRDGFPPNVWIGTSVEDQKAADERIPHLVRVPAAVRFLSCEPLLGAVDLTRWLSPDGEWRCPACPYKLHKRLLRACDGSVGLDTSTAREVCPNDGRTLIPNPQLSWVIAGGESGPGARPMHPDWVRSIRDQCVAAGVPFFYKQWGEWLPMTDYEAILSSGSVKRFAIEPRHLRYCYPDGRVADREPGNGDDSPVPFNFLTRVGKSVAGRLLNGKQWDEFPTNGMKEAGHG